MHKTFCELMMMMITVSGFFLICSAVFLTVFVSLNRVHFLLGYFVHPLPLA